MAQKKYLSLEKLGLYDEKIKALINTKDAETLASAKDYADGLADNYDAAGSAATALNDAKAYADGKDAAIAAAKKAGDDAAAAAAVADGKAVDAQNAADAAQAAADAAQADVDALETYVGTIPTVEGEETPADVIAYINKKTSGIATDTALAELQSQVNTNKTDIAAVKADYLKTADKTELQGNIDAVDNRVDTLVDTDTGKSVRTIANEELAAQLIPETAKESLDTLQEIAAWIQSHPDDASAMSAAIDALEALVGTIPEDATAATIVAYIQELVNAEKTRAEGVEASLDGRLDTLEAAVGESGSIATDIATAKQEAIEAAAADATTKANAAQSAAEATAKSYTDTEVGKDRTRLDALEAASHTHANKALLDTYTQTEVDLADAVAKKHEHANKTVLDGITAEKVTAWDTVGSKAAQADLEAEVSRATAAEAALGARIDEFVEISQEEINALFTA